MFPCRSQSTGSPLNTSIPTPLLHLRALCPFPFSNANPRPNPSCSQYFQWFLPRYCLWFLLVLIFAFLTVNVQQGKQPHNQSRGLSPIVPSVYCRFHAPPHQQPIFPGKHTHTHTQRNAYAYVLTAQLNGVNTCSQTHKGLSVAVGLLCRSQSHGLIMNENYYKHQSGEAVNKRCVCVAQTPAWHTNPHVRPIQCCRASLPTHIEVSH